MPLSPPAAREQIKLFIKVFTDEFLGGFQSEIDVESGRPKRRLVFTDKLKDAIKKMVGALPWGNVANLVGDLAAEMVSTLMEIVSSKAIDAAVDSKFAPAAGSVTALQADLEGLRLIIEAVARQAVQDYECHLTQQLSEKPLTGVKPLALGGVERCLHYLTKYLKNKQQLGQQVLSTEFLSRALIEGESGRFVSGWFNTELAGQEEAPENMSVEGVLGRSGFCVEKVDAKGDMCPTFWVLSKTDRNIAIKQKTLKGRSKKDKFGYVNFSDGDQQAQEPKYLYRFVNQSLVDEYGYKPHHPGSKTAPKFGKFYSKRYYRSISRQNIEAYLAQRTAGHSSLTAFIRQHQKVPDDVLELQLVCHADLSGVPLTGGDFTGVDFSKAIITGDLTGTCWDNAYLFGTQFIDVVCDSKKSASFKKANLSFAQLTKAKLSSVDFSGANFSFANVTDAELSVGGTQGVCWYQTEGLEKTTVANGLLVEQQRQQVEDYARESKAHAETLTKWAAEWEKLTNWQATITEQLETLATQIAHQSTNAALTAQDQHVKQLQAQVEDYKRESKAHAEMLNKWAAEWEKLTNWQATTIKQLEALATEVAHPATNAALTAQDQHVKQLQAQVEDIWKHQADLLYAERKQREVNEVHKQAIADLQTQVQDSFRDLQTRIQQLEATQRQQQQAIAELKDEQEAQHIQLHRHDAKLEDHRHRLDYLEQKLQSEQADTLVILIRAQEQLKAAYLGDSEIRGLFGKPFQLEGQYINLQLRHTIELKPDDVKDDEKHNKKEKRATYQDARISTFEDLPGDKQPLTLPNLFKSDHELFLNARLKPQNYTTQSPKLLLIQGRAGIGKSTFVRYIVREWAKGALYEQFTWVFTLILRDLEGSAFVQEHSQLNLAEWIYRTHFKAGNMMLPEFQRLWLTSIEPALTQNQVLFILDGWDELPTHHCCKEALQALLKGIYAETPKLITTRPYGLSELPTQRREIELMGFTDENIVEYVKIYFSEKPEAATVILENLKTQPLVWRSAHIPVNANLICGLNDKAFLSAPNDKLLPLESMTDLYQAMETKLLERTYLEREINDSKLPESSLRRQKTLHTSYKKERNFMARLAFEGMQRECAVFARSHIDTLLEEQKIAHDVSFMKRIRALGLLKPVMNSTAVRKMDYTAVQENACAYEFIHLTFQEYYAAVYVASTLQLLQTDNPRDPAVREMMRVISREKYNPRWEIVWWLVAGLLKETPKILICYLQTLRGKNYFSAVTPQIIRTNDLFRHYELGLLARCVDEADTPTNHELLQPYRSILQKALWECGRQKLFSQSSFFKSLQLSPRLLRASGADDMAKELLHENRDDYTFVQSISILRIVTPGILSRLTILLADSGNFVSWRVVEVVSQLGAAAATPRFLAHLAELLRDTDWQVCQTTLKAVSNLGAAAATDDILARLRELLGDANEEVCKAAFYTVGHLGSAAAKPAFLACLVELLRDANKDIRWRAADAVGQLGAAAATSGFLAHLAELLRDTDWQVCQTTLKAVSNLGAAAATDDILSLLVELLVHEKWQVRVEALGVVGSLGLAAARDDILARLAGLLNEDTHLDVLHAAIGVVGKLGSVAATDDILARLASLLAKVNYFDETLIISAWAADAVGCLGSAAVKPAFLARLVELLRDANTSVRRKAADAVGQLGAAAATSGFLACLVELLGDVDWQVCQTTLKAVSNLGAAAATDDILSLLVKLLVHENWQVRVEALGVVGGLGLAAARDDIFVRLRELLRDVNEEVRKAALYTVGQVGPAAARDDILARLAGLLKDTDWRVRCHIARVVGKLGFAAAAHDILVRLLRDTNDEVRKEALDTMGQLGVAAVTDDILACIAELLRDTNVDVRKAALGVVSKLGTVAATDDILARLAELLVDEEYEAVANALDSLGSAAATPNFLACLAGMLAVDAKEYVHWRAVNMVGRLGVAAATSDILARLGGLLLDVDTGIDPVYTWNAVCSVLVKLILAVIKTKLSEWFVVLTHNVCPRAHFNMLVALIVGGYLSGKVSLQLMQTTDRECLAYGFVGKEAYEFPLTLVQAQELQALVAAIIEQLSSGKFNRAALMATMSRSFASSGAVNSRNARVSVSIASNAVYFFAPSPISGVMRFSVDEKDHSAVARKNHEAGSTIEVMKKTKRGPGCIIS